MDCKQKGQKKKINGFTLIELIMIIVILGFLIITAIPKFLNLKTEAQLATAKGITAALQSSLKTHYANFLLFGTSYNFYTIVNDAQISGIKQYGIEPESNLFTVSINADLFTWEYTPPDTIDNSGQISENFF